MRFRNLLWWRREADVKVDESAPTLSSLAPAYSFGDHGVYFSILRTTIETKPDVKNIALAGTYGTGKSSILNEVARVYEDRVVQLSLLTLGVEPEMGMPVDSNPAAKSKTNRIQKEVVKQLLYQQRPTDAPDSRFHRITRFRWGMELPIAGVVGVAAAALALVAGLDIVTRPSLALTVADRPHEVSVALMLVSIALVAGAVTLAVRALARGRAGIEKVTAGPATITLPARSTSYFDEYLDEIIYFFETNPKRDIVIIEDLDRFDDPNIFESLRSLNGLLNSAKQTGKRSIRFIYAVRDSVFEKLGQDVSLLTSDENRAELVRSNRTKFFELVVPVVPFITHKNARDLMAALLEERKHAVSKDLVDLSARHLPDMRLVHNILNEFAVFKHRLLDVDTPVPELDADRLFAMILYKNAHMGDFEKIRHAASDLDTLWESWRSLVRDNLALFRNANREHRKRAAGGKLAETYAMRVGAAVRKRIDALAAAPGSTLTSPSIYYRGVVVDDIKLTSADFWSEFASSVDPLTIQVTAYYGTQHLQLTTETLETLTGEALDPKRFIAAETEDADVRIKENNEDIAFLQRHTWRQLADNTQYTYTPVDAGKPLSFRDTAKATLKSELAAELVFNGYITEYFPLHVSAFYGKLIRPDAMTYVMRYIDHGVADPDYHLDDEDVRAIIRDQGRAVLSERSMFNVGILNYLLVHDPAGATVVVQAVASDTTVGPDFADRYLEMGARKVEFVARLASRKADIFSNLISSESLTRDERVTLVDAAIQNRAAKLAYNTSPELRDFIETHYAEFSSLQDGAPDTASRSAVRFVAQTGAVLPSLGGLTPAAIEQLRGTEAYVISRENLEALTGGSDISLDALRLVDDAILAHASSNPGAYSKAFLDSTATDHTVRTAATLAAFMRASRGAAPTSERTVAEHADSSIRVEDLSDLPPATWPPVVRFGLVEPSFSNVSAYVEEHGMVDEDLARLLADVSEIPGSGEADVAMRSSLALAIINSPSDALTGAHRAELAASLQPGVLAAASIDPLRGPMVGDLLAAGLIADDADAFSVRLMLDWDTQRHAITHSATFKDNLGPAVLQASFLAQLLDDDELRELHLPAANSFGNYSQLSKKEWTAYAKRALEGGYSLGAGTIKMVLKGGADQAIIINLLAKFIPKLKLEELQGILTSLGDPWSKVSAKGYGVTSIADTPAARAVLAALQEADIVSNFPAHDGLLRVSLRQPKNRKTTND